MTCHPDEFVEMTTRRSGVLALEGIDIFPNQPWSMALTDYRSRVLYLIALQKLVAANPEIAALDPKIQFIHLGEA